MSMRPGEKVLAAPEELGLDSRTVFRRAATELLEQLAEGAGRLVIDLAGTRQIDSAGLGALMLIQRKAAGGTRIYWPTMGSPTLGPRRKVLFVEDESTLRRTYKRFFAERYHLAFAASGTEARRQMDEFHPEVLVLDLRLPDTDGITLLQEIRQSQPSLPVIVTTSYVSMEPLINVLDLGHSGYLVKPFDLEDLAARIDALG